jgi:hypothetical protein
MTFEKSYTAEQEKEILRAYLTEMPRPSYRALARRFKLSEPCVRRIIKRHKLNPGAPGAIVRMAKAQLTLSGDTAAEALTTEIVTQDGTPVIAITRETTMGQVQSIAFETRRQYLMHQDNPTIAGGYLRLLRDTYEMIGRWLGMDKVPIEKKDDEKTITEVHIVYDTSETKP